MIDYRRMRGSAGLADLQNWTRFDLSGSQAGDAFDAVVGCNVRDLFEGRAATFHRTSRSSRPVCTG